MLSWYLHKFIDWQGAEHVQAELIEEKKITVVLRAEVETLRTTHGGCEKKQTNLQLELNEAKQQLMGVAERIQVTQVRGDQVVKECGRLKAATTNQVMWEEELANERKPLTARLA